MRAKLAMERADIINMTSRKYLTNGKHDLQKSEVIRCIRLAISQYGLPVHEEEVKFIELPNKHHPQVKVFFKNGKTSHYTVLPKQRMNTPLPKRSWVYDSRKYFSEKALARDKHSTKLCKQLGFTFN